MGNSETSLQAGRTAGDQIIADRAIADRAIGYLVVGHGTRNRSGQEQVRRVFWQMTQLDGGEGLRDKPAELAFLELAEPDIPTAIERLFQAGVRELVVVPVLLFSAGHAHQDIPDAVEIAAGRFGIRVVRQCTSLCLDPTIVALSAERFHQALARHVDFPADTSKVALALVGRGSSSAPATAAMVQFAEIRFRATPVGWSSVGFIHAQRPTVDEVLDALAATGLPWLVVQPHLLFEGELSNDLRIEVKYRQSFSNSQKWIITDTLGSGAMNSDDRLAAALCRLALDTASLSQSTADSVCSRCQQASHWCRIATPTAANSAMG